MFKHAILFCFNPFKSIYRKTQTTNIQLETHVTLTKNSKNIQRNIIIKKTLKNNLYIWNTNELDLETTWKSSCI